MDEEEHTGGIVFVLVTFEVVGGIKADATWIYIIRCVSQAKNSTCLHAFLISGGFVFPLVEA